MTVLSYKEDLTARFVQGFTEDIVCFFPDGYHNGATDIGSTFINMSSFVDGQDQPTDDYWMSYKIDDSFVFNDSITDGNVSYKRKVVFVDFSIYWPQELSSKRLDQIIEPTIDDIFENIKFRGSDDSEIFNQQDNPKDTTGIVRAQGTNKFNRKDITYAFVVRYI